MLLVDVAAVAVPPELPLLKRQHPTTNVMLLAATLDPALMLEGMRAGVNECLAEPLRAGGLRCRDHPAARPARARRRPARCSRSSAPRAASARRRRRSTSRRRWRSSRPPARCWSTCTWPTAMPPSSSAPRPRFSLLDALENLHRLDADVPQEPGGANGVGLDSAGVSGPSGDQRRGHAAALDSVIRVRRQPVSPTRCSTCRARTSRCSTASIRDDDRRRGEPGARDGPQRRTHGGGAARALPDSESHDRHQPDRSAAPRSASTTSRRRSAAPSRISSRATTGARCWRCTRAARWRSTITTSSRPRSPRLRASSPASEATKKPEKASGLLRDFSPVAKRRTSNSSTTRTRRLTHRPC